MAQITEDYVSYETAKLLKEKGFDENTSVNYFVGDDKPRGCMIGEMIYHKRMEEDTHLAKLEKAVFDMLVERTNEITISEKQARKYAPIFLAIVKDEILKWVKDAKVWAAPTLWVAMKWLREVHGLFIFISTWRMLENSVQYYFEIREIKTRDFETLYDYTSKEINSYEKACEEAIRYCLENLI